MYVHAADDLKYLDSFHLPTFLDPSVEDYKEWYHFIFHDAENDLFGFLNFSLVGNPYNSTKSVGGALVFFQESNGGWVGGLELLDSSIMRVSPIMPSFLAGDSAVIFEEDRSFRLVGFADDRKIRFDLSFSPDSLPVSTKGPGLGLFGAKPDGRSEMEPIKVMKRGIGAVAEGWVAVPRMVVNGSLTIGGRALHVRGSSGYHDHNWGTFPWGDPFGWDGGVMLGNMTRTGEPLVVGFLIDRSPYAIRGKEGGLFVRGRGGFKRIFSGKALSINSQGRFSGQIKRFPGSEQLLYPDSHPKFPETITLRADDGIDSVGLNFSPQSLCQLTTRDRAGRGKTVWDELFGRATVKGSIAGVEFDSMQGFWMESVRSSK